MKAKPATEIALEELQNRFLKDRDLRILAEMYQELWPYVRSLLLKFIKNKIFLPPEMVSDTSKDICLLILDKYRTKPDFKIESSFAGYLKFKIIEILYAPQKVWEEQCGSLNTLLSGDKKDKGKTTEVGELSETLKFDYLFPVLSSNPEEHFFKVDANAAIQSVWSVFEDLFTRQSLTNIGTRRGLLVSLALLIYLQKNQTALSQFWQIFITSEETSNLYDIALLEIFNRLNG